MDTAQLKQTIKQQIEVLSGDRLRLVVDFLNFLIQTEEQEQPPTSDTSGFRPPEGGSLLSHTETWEGPDFEDCLETVIETRSQLQS
jgi:hypothetical protein